MKKLDLFIHALQGKSITVIGMGVSNYPLIQLLLDKNIPCLIRDKKPDPRQKELEEKGAKFLIGEGYLENLTEEIIFRTPGLSSNTPQLLKAKENGQHITSEMQEFFHFCPCPILAVTGSDGKTTTTTLISKFLEETEKNVFVGGNIGNPLLCDVDKMTLHDIVVVELSSFQLMDLDCRPDVAVLTNLSPNHLDYHGTMEEYVQAKTNIFCQQPPEKKVIFNKDNEESMKLLPLAKGKVKLFSRLTEEGDAIVKNNSIYLGNTPYLSLDQIQLKGVHNLENFMTAILAVEDYCTPAQIQSVAQNFFGVKHRMQQIATQDGVTYYNDSIATSPTRCIAGLHSFDERIILIAGGYDKGISFTDLGGEIHNRVKHLVLVGDTAKAIDQAVTQSKASPEKLAGEFQGIHHCQTLAMAISKAKELSQTGDNIVLSPACAAFDQFENFAQRGTFFEEFVLGQHQN